MSDDSEPKVNRLIALKRLVSTKYYLRQCKHN
jgi:hypothetical protein